MIFFGAHYAVDVWAIRTEKTTGFRFCTKKAERWASKNIGDAPENLAGSTLWINEDEEQNILSSLHETGLNVLIDDGRKDGE